ncbi:MAG: GGDEF domain-containing protein [Candidatus Hydrogenedentales bacterium]
MDSKTSFIFLISGNFLILLLLCAYRKKYTEEALRYHFFSQLMMTLSYVFVLLRLWRPIEIFAVLNTLPTMVSVYFESLALFGLSDALTMNIKKKLRIPLFTGIALYSLSVIAGVDPYIRIIVITVFDMVIILPAVLRALFMKDGSSLRIIMGILFVLMVVSLGIRIADALRLGPALVIFGSSLGEEVTIAGLYLYMILGGMGMILFAKEQTDARLIRLAHYDGATGVFNRDGFIDAMMTAIDKISYDNTAFSMLQLDIDGLNEINELHGYVVGDGFILSTAERLRDEAGERGFVGRLSGDEFMVFLNGVDREHLDGAVSAFRAAVSRNSSDGIACSVSIGAVAFDNPAGRDIHFPMIYATCADALKSAKNKGYGETVIALT